MKHVSKKQHRYLYYLVKKHQTSLVALYYYPEYQPLLTAALRRELYQLLREQGLLLPKRRAK